MRSKYYTPFWKTPLKWIPRSKSGASKPRPRWVAHTHISPPRIKDLSDSVMSNTLLDLYAQ